MEDKSKEEKKAAGRLLLQKYQKKAKDGKSSPSQKNNTKDCNNPNDISKLNQELNAVFETPRNGHFEYDLKASEEKVNSTSVPVNLFTSQKGDSPAEQFFDSFRPSPQSSEHSEKYDTSNNNSPVVLSYDVPSTSHRKEIEKSSDFSSSRSSKSEDETHKRSAAEDHCNYDPVKEELEKKLLESNNKVTHLETELRKAKLDLDHVKVQEVMHEERKEEKLQLHLKTIEILVGEKSELQQELAKVKVESHINMGKNEELSAKLNACQEQMSSLKDELSEIYEAREQHNTILKKLEHSLAEANATAEMNRKEVIDAQEEIKTLKQKMEQVVNHSEEMKKMIADKDKKLSFAEMRLAQLGAVQNIPTKDEIIEVEELKKECTRLEGEINKLIQEKSEIVCQYQQYIDTLNSQIQLLNQQYESCLISKNHLLTREETLVKHISDLEKKVQKEHQAGPSLTETNLKLNQELNESKEKLTELNASLEEKLEEVTRLNAALEETSTKLNEAELTLDRLEVPDARKLQAAIESDRVAAKRAIQQNTQLKENIIELQEAVVRLNNEKLDLTEKWQHEEHVTSELRRELRQYKGKEEAEYRDAVAQCPVVFYESQACQADMDELDMPTSLEEHVTPEAVVLLKKKLKKTMNDYATIYEEKQNLEHLVLHLQSETETIGEYVTLYQNQRSLLQARGKERDRQMAEVSKEREELKSKLALISSLLPRVIQESGTIPTQTPLSNRADSNSDPATKIKTLLNEIESSNLMNNTDPGTPSNFHPCLLCSGKLITI